jgi:DNA-binding beta-propeller fold protein YncE
MTLTRVAFVPIPPGPQAGFDHADIYILPARSDSRLYLAHTGADRIEVIDCPTRSYQHALPDLPGVAGVLIDSAQDLLFSSDRGCARVSVYRCSDEVLLGRVAVGPHPNGLAYDPSRRHLLAFNLGDPPGENCTVSVVAVDELEVVATLPLPGRPRWAVYDADADQVYANIRAPAQIVVLDARRLRLSGVFEVPAAGPHGLALSGGRLFCAADAGALVALERDSGSVIGGVTLAGEPDVIMHDLTLGRLYVAVGSPGVVHVVDERRLELLETVPTEEGAHTIGWDPVGRALYAFLPASQGAAVFAEQ